MSRQKASIRPSRHANSADIMNSKVLMIEEKMTIFLKIEQRFLGETMSKNSQTTEYS